MDELLILPGGMWTPDDADDSVEKYVFGYPAGKSRMKEGLIKMFPPHTTYVEPFCGSAAVFFAKDRVDREVLNDRDPEVIETLRTISTMSKADGTRLLAMDWKGDRRKFKQVLDSKPGSKLGKLHRFLYLSLYSYGLMRRHFNPGLQGHTGGIAQRAVKRVERLKGVTFRNGDYASVVREFDSKDTLFFMDPPYPGYDVKIGERQFDESAFVDLLKSLKGKFVVTYGVRGKADFSKFNVQRVNQFRSISTMRGVNRDKVLSTLIVSNYSGPAYKAFGHGFDIEEPGLHTDMVSASSDGDPYAEAPSDGERRIATLKLRSVDDKFFADLWIDTGNHAVGWSMDVQRTPAKKVESIAEAFSVDGSRALHALTTGVAASQLGVLDNGIHKADGEAGEGRIIQTDACYVEHGLHTDTMHEYFLSKGKELVGVLRMKRVGDGWEAQLSKTSLTPAVLESSDAPLPPFGVSALPDSLAKQIHPLLQFWTMKGDAAMASRDALVASRFAAPDSLALVNGEVRKVRRVVELYEPEQSIDLSPEWHLEKLAEHYGGPLEECFSTEDSPRGSDVAFYDLASHDVADAVTQLAVFKSSSEFALSCLDSPETREALGKHGRLFRFVPDHPAHAIDVCKRIFVASFPLSKTDDIEWVADPKPAGDDAPSIPKELAKRLESEVVILSKQEEQRLVTGIVLVPEEVDSQNDIYSAEEVQKASFAYMEAFQNVGLMHRKMVTGKVRIVESFIAREDYTEGGQSVKKGTWVMTTRVLDDALWKAVKEGKLTGYSIGGSAVRVPAS